MLTLNSNKVKRLMLIMPMLIALSINEDNVILVQELDVQITSTKSLDSPEFELELRTELTQAQIDLLAAQQRATLVKFTAAVQPTISVTAIF